MRRSRLSTILAYAALFVYLNTAEDELPEVYVDPAEDVSNHPNVRLLPFDNCGTMPVLGRIAHGRSAGVYELPWMSLNINIDDSDITVNCAGTVITERYILTAAHCISDKFPNFMLLGDNDLNADEDCEERFNGSHIIKECAPPPQLLPVEEIIQHQNFGYHMYNDIALLRLAVPANFSNGNVRPICLPIGEAQQRNTLLGKYAYISGWGQTEKSNGSYILLKAAVKVMDLKNCNYKVPISPVAQLCAGSKLHNHDTCGGDSGGPLTYFGEVNNSLRAMLYGVVSFGDGRCGEAKQMSIYTHVGYYMKWILDNMKP